MTVNLFKQSKVNNTFLTALPFTKEIVMEAFLVENPDILKFDPSTEVVFGDNQIHLKGGGKLGGDGRLDMLVCFREPDCLGIIELKNGKISEENVSQLERYLKQRHNIMLDGLIEGNDIPKDWVGILVGTAADAAFLEKVDAGIACCNNTVPIKVILLNRYVSETTGDVYVFSEVYAKKEKKTVYGISVLDLIVAGKIERGATITLNRKNVNYSAKILDDGRICYNDEIFKSLSGAARAATNVSIDGWSAWRTSDGKSLSEIRSAHIAAPAQ